MSTRQSPIRTILALLLLPAGALGQYQARTDTALIPYPAAVPAIGAAGSTYFDSSFGSTTLRATDQNSDKVVRTYATTNYSGRNAWAPDSSAFVFLDNEGALWRAAFNPAAGTVTGLTRNGYNDLGHAEYCLQAPITVWGTPAYPLLEKIDSSGKETTVIDWRTVYTASAIPYTGDVSTSQDCTRIAGVAWPEQNLGRMHWVWDTVNNGYTYLDSQTLTVTGQWGQTGALVWQNPTSPGATLPPFFTHDAEISRDGKWMELGGGQNSNFLAFWQIGTTSLWTFPGTGVNLSHDCIGSGGHDGMGFAMFYNTCPGVPPSGTKWLPDFFVKLGLGWWTGPYTALVSTVMSGYTALAWDYHISANDAAGGTLDSNPIFISTEFPTQPTGLGVEPLATSPGMNEIEGICTACATPTVWRFGHTFYNFNTQLSQCCGPTGNVSPDGHWFIFTSDWAGTLGSWNTTGFRNDVFVLNLAGTVYQAGLKGQGSGAWKRLKNFFKKR